MTPSEQVGSSSIRLEGVGKRYTKYEDTPALVTSAQRWIRRSRRSQFWAVRDVDLDVPAGECLGVIGRNGSGKSTLLQMMCGVTDPSSGRVRVRGRIAPLISVGVGFHPELTGRENVYINATILGLSTRQIDAKLDEIVAFSGIEDFIDTPVKFYSSGMFVRLGFSVAIQVEPDVLLVDEVLAVGDLAFQMKCYDQMKKIRESGATVVFVTHNLNVVRNFCDRVVVLDGGRAVYDGRPNDAVDRFHEMLNESREPEGADLGWAVHVSGLADLSMSDLMNARGERTASFDGGEDLRLRLQVAAHTDVAEAFVGINVHASNGSLIYGQVTYDSPIPVMAAGDTAAFTVTVPAHLTTGSYTISAGLYQRDLNGEKLRQLSVTRGRTFHVSNRRLVSGVADLGATIHRDTADVRH